MSSKEAFEPDVILTKEHPLARYATIYLDGQKLERCFEARIHWGSFVEPTFGEVVIGAMRGEQKNVHVIMFKPHLGEFDYEGIWVRFACGKVLVDLDGTGKNLLETIVRKYEA